MKYNLGALIILFDKLVENYMKDIDNTFRKANLLYMSFKHAIYTAALPYLDKIDICLCSPLKRTRKTAEILVGNKKEIIYDDLLVERGFGDYEGKKIDFDLIVPQWDYKLNDSSNNIESIQDCLLRADKFLTKIKKEYPNKSILIVSHGSFIKALHFNLVGYDENMDFLSFNPKNTTLYIYDY